MPAARASSSPPAAALSAAVAKRLPLASSRTAAAFRAGDLPRGISPERAQARATGAACLQAATNGTSKAEIAGWFGSRSDRVGTEILSGKVPVSLGEAVLLPPLDVAKRSALETLRRRYEIDLASDDLPDALRARCRADLALIDALIATSSAA